MPGSSGSHSHRGPRGLASGPAFLRSRIAQRILWVLLAAALAPMTALALLGHQAFVAREEMRAQHRAKDHLKQMGLRLYDRLESARATLSVHAALATWQSPGSSTPTSPTTGASAMLTSVIPLAATGRTAPAGLAWQPLDGGTARVQMALPARAGSGWWVAEVSPMYLWADFRSEGAGAGLCVVDASTRPLFCPQGLPPAGASSEWPLFMGAGFNTPDWRIVGPRSQLAIEGVATGELPYARLVGLGFAATLLVAALLGLVMVRRTLVPLERLTEGTRRLARGERSARVALASDDEFGELAGSLNGMAAHIEGQWEALEVQARIDREMLDGAPLVHTLRQVVERMRRLMPGAEVCVVARDVAGGGWLLHPQQIPCTLPVPSAASDGFAIEGRLEADAPAPLWRTVVDSACGESDRHRHLTWVPAVWRGETVAWLLVQAKEPLALPDNTRRELESLRDRVALALAAAAREHHLIERAVRDPLTGLLNRHGLHDACDLRLCPQDTGEPRPAFSLVFIDLDGFKEVNDTLGHPVGDAVLRTVADRLRGLAPPGATVARAGGDEFVVLLPGPAEAAEHLAESLCRAVALPIAQREHLIHLGASAGIACHPVDAQERDELLRRADVAMYAAKTAGRGHWKRYADTMDAASTERAWITRELRIALERGALELHYQPRVDPRDGHVSSTEALVRWTHPERGPIPPGRFVPIAEETGLIERLGAFVLDAALAQQRRWRDAGVGSGRVAVNVSVRQLRDSGFVAGILAALQRHGVAPADLELEITESLFAGDPASVQRALQPLRELGVWVALDDFGTGYSSLAALQSLPIDVLKIDRSFVIELGVRESALAVVRSVIALARALGKRVVAEGVETPAQERHLLAVGCDEFQGYLYTRPLPPGPFEARLAAGFGRAGATASEADSAERRTEPLASA